MDHDQDLRARFEALAREDAAAAPDFSRPKVDAHGARLRAGSGRQARRAAGGLAALAAAAAAAFTLWPREPDVWLELPATTWTTPSDFLLETPGSEFLRTIPSFEARTPITSPSAAGVGRDSAGRAQP